MLRPSYTLALLAVMFECACTSSHTLPLQEDSNNPANPATGYAQGRLETIHNFPTTGIAARPVYVWLPPGYETSERRYPVLYMHDGQNLFEPGRSYAGNEWGVDETMPRLIAEKKIRAAIIVAIENTDRRWQEYAPAKVIDRLPAAYRGKVLAERGGPPLSDAYLGFLTDQLRPYIDNNYRTLTDPGNRFIMGSSMGGLISLYAVAERPDIFGAAACISTHWPLHDARIEGAWDAAVKAMTNYLDASQLDPRHQRIWFDHGTENLDSYYPPYQAAMNNYFVGRGFIPEKTMLTKVYMGADHNELSWAERLADPLIFLLGR